MANNLHDDLSPDSQFKVTPLHDLFPFRLATTVPLVDIRGLFDAYNWVHSPSLLKMSHECGDVPAFFLTRNRIEIDAAYLKAIIGGWLVNHRACWVGLKFTATGWLPP